MTTYDIGDGAEVEFKDGVVHIRGKPPYANFRISLKDEDAKVLWEHLNKKFGSPITSTKPIPEVTTVLAKTSTRKKKYARKKEESKED